MVRKWSSKDEKELSVTKDAPLEYVSVPKISTVHQGFAGTFTHMDGSDGEEKERKKHS